MSPIMRVLALVLCAGRPLVATPAELTVAVAQTASNRTTTPEQMGQHMIGYVARAAAAGARVVVFPEMAVVGYWPETINCTRCAQRLPPVEDAIAAACGLHGIYCIFGIPHFVNDTHYYNTAVVVDASGRKVYRQAKLSLAWPSDGLPGRWLDTFDIDGVSAALMICADEFVPEVARLPALKGAQLQFYLSYEGDASTYMYGSNAQFDVAYHAIPSARAAENRMPLVQANAALLPRNVGTMGGSHGQSRITDAEGHVLKIAPIFGEALLVHAVRPRPAGATYPALARAMPIFAKMWEAGMASVFSRMPIDLRE